MTDEQIAAIRRTVDAAAREAAEVGISLERYDSGLNVPDARALLDALEAARAARPMACPCLYTTPCDPGCTCVRPFSSRGCDRCCTYGSEEQQRGRAEALASLGAENERLRAALLRINRLLAEFRGGDPARTSVLALTIIGVIDAALAARTEPPTHNSEPTKRTPLDRSDDASFAADPDDDGRSWMNP